MQAPTKSHLYKQIGELEELRNRVQVAESALLLIQRATDAEKEYRRTGSAYGHKQVATGEVLNDIRSTIVWYEQQRIVMNGTISDSAARLMEKYRIAKTKDDG